MWRNPWTPPRSYDFLNGAGSAIQLFPHLDGRYDTDGRALRSDWNRVGGYLSWGMERFGRENIRQMDLPRY